jgi:hypothetical protein
MLMQDYASLVNDPRAELKWNLSNWPAASMGSDIAATVHKAAKEQYPDLADMFPFGHGVEAKHHVGTNYICVSLLSISGAHLGGGFNPEEIAELEAAASHSPWTPDELVGLLGSKWFSEERFTYIGPYRKPCAWWQHAVVHLNAWLNKFVLPDILSRNQARVQRAIPAAPHFDPAPILDALWVLESEAESRQGTAFRLAGVGLVTNAHVLANDTHAFRASGDTAFERMSIRVVQRNDVIDLAVLAIDSDVGGAIEGGTADELDLMHHLLVAGYPNYRLGDSGHVAPGLVTGFRTVSGIRRILTNAAIVAGNSGGPVIGADGKVVGVAVTGAERPDLTLLTENHGIIPIDALAHLG